MMVGFLYLYKLYILIQNYDTLRVNLERLRGDHQQLSNEASMDDTYASALHVGLICAGGSINLNEEITEQDWDNWHYVEKRNKCEDNPHGRRELHRLRRVGRSRRHSTPGRASSDDCIDSDEMTESEYQ